MRLSLLFIVFSWSSAALANTYSVSNGGDSGMGSLRQAILDANAHLGVDEIRFSFIGPVALRQELPVINDSLTIWGTSQNTIIVVGWGQTGDRSAFRVAMQSPLLWTTVNLYNLTVDATTANGQPVRILSTSGDRAVVNILNSHFANGGTTGLAPQLGACPRGGVIASVGSRVNIHGSRFYDNRATTGGAIYAENGRVVIADSELFDNGASEGGGAIRLVGGIHTLDRVTLKANTAGGYSGGGALHISGGGAVVTVRNSTFSENHALKGGGGHIAVAAGSLSVTSSTLAFGDSDGPFDKGEALWSRSAQAVIVRDSILHANATPVCDLNLPIAAGARNIATDASCATSIVGDPRLFPLAPNNGTTETHAIDPSSPAFKAADPATCISPSQNGVANRLSDGTCDLGAYEF